MRWLKVRIETFNRFQQPDICPNCLDANANQPVAIHRTFGIPFIASTTVSGHWLFCASCARLFQRGRRWQWGVAFGPGLILIGISAWMAIQNANINSATHPAVLLFWSGFVVAVFGTLAVRLVIRLKPPPPGCLSRLPTVKPIRVETTFMGKEKAGEYRFAHPIYLEQLIAMNPPDVVEVNAKQLQQAIQSFEAKHAG